MEFKALRIPVLTEEVAANLEKVLTRLPGIQELKITLDTQELRVVFDEDQLGFQTLIEEMARAGCPLRNIDAALLL